jgi:hypothetical protein
MVSRSVTRYVDVSNPALAIDCPRCGLITARFMEFCSNCGYQLWPSGEMATAAFLEWKAADPSRAGASRYMLALPGQSVPEAANVIDYDARANELGIHVFMPYTPYPIVICVGMLILGLAAVQVAQGEPSWLRIALGVVGAVIFLYGVFGWVVREDVRIYPGDDNTHPGEHGDGH